MFYCECGSQEFVLDPEKNHQSLKEEYEILIQKLGHAFSLLPGAYVCKNCGKAVPIENYHDILLTDDFNSFIKMTTSKMITAKLEAQKKFEEECKSRFETEITDGK